MEFERLFHWNRRPYFQIAKDNPRYLIYALIPDDKIEARYIRCLVRRSTRGTQVHASLPDLTGKRSTLLFDGQSILDEKLSDLNIGTVRPHHISPPLPSSLLF